MNLLAFLALCLLAAKSSATTFTAKPTTTPAVIDDDEMGEDEEEIFCIDVDQNCAKNGQIECQHPITAHLSKLENKSEPTEINHNTTATGLRCQKWSSQEPHGHKFPNVGDHNFCSNPDAELGPWCYTENPNVRWEYCFPTCPDEYQTPCVVEEEECAKNGQVTCRTSYQPTGDNFPTTTKNTTVSEKVCQNWSEQKPHGHYYSRMGNHNFCSNPDGSDGPWCYTENPNVRWEYCFPTCPDEYQTPCVVEEENCAKNGQVTCRTSYLPMGDNFPTTTKNTTVSEKVCQNWSEQKPHGHYYSRVGNHNFCSNPDGEDGPWCYTIDESVRWEYCYDTCS